jgi:hypothetical protein
METTSDLTASVAPKELCKLAIDLASDQCPKSERLRGAAQLLTEAARRLDAEAAEQNLRIAKYEKDEAIGREQRQSLARDVILSGHGLWLEDFEKALGALKLERNAKSDS